MRISAPALFLGTVLATGVAQAEMPQVGTLPLDVTKINAATTTTADRLAIILGKKSDGFIYPVPFQSESNVGMATVPGRNASIVSCSPAAVWMLLQSTGQLPTTTTFADFVTLSATHRSAMGWTHQGFKEAAAEYGIGLEVNDYGDRTKFSEGQAWDALASDLSRGPVSLSIIQVDPNTGTSESKNTHMVVLRGATSNGTGDTNLIVNDPIAKSENTPRNASGAQARDHRVGVTTWPVSFVEQSSTDRWLAMSK